MRSIDSAMWDAYMVHSYKKGDVIRVEDFSVCLKERRLPVCPAGGTYTIPPLGGKVSCSIHGQFESDLKYGR